MINKYIPSQRVQLLLSSVLVLSTTTFGLSGCNTEGAAEGLVPVQAAQNPADLWWNIPDPDFTQNEDMPIITLKGERTLILALGETYEEPGATAADTIDGDLSDSIAISHSVDVNQAGDYLVRYQLTDSDGNNAVEINRVVRVYDDEPTAISERFIGDTQANFGYLEHLPTDYGIDPDKKYPIIIYHHGNGVNAERAGTDPKIALGKVLLNGGPPTQIHQGDWDNDLPFIVLTPQAGRIDFASDMLRIDAFVEYAKHTYNVDTSKVYMAGWSQGAFLSYEYAVVFPEKVAAVVGVSGGIPYGDRLPGFFCDVETVPMWLFHGSNDEVVPSAASITGQGRIIDECQPTELPKLSIVVGANHSLHDSIFDLSGLIGGEKAYEFDFRFDEYDQSVYEWLLSHELATE